MLSLFAGLTHRRALDWNETQPVSAEIFGQERFRQHARSLAESQAVSPHPSKVRSIVLRLGDNSAALLEAYREICAAVASGKTVTPASEWLIDNYHLVEEHIRQTRADLPERFYRQLPKLAAGPLAGHPRIFGLAWAYVAHTDSRFDPDTLSDFVNEYQAVQPLSIGELWAVAISLRLILIENLRRTSQRMTAARRAREAADQLADKALTVSESSAAAIFGSAGEPDVSQPFAVQLIQRLRDQDAAADMLVWLRGKTDTLGYSFEEAVNDEHHRQAAANVSVRNIVTSMRLISDVNWESWFDSVSMVDKLLRTRAVYGGMDFPSRTVYRTAVEELARGSGIGELDVAQRALDDANDDPGFHLAGPGRARFETALGFRPPPLHRARAAIRKLGLSGYLGAIAALTTGLLIAGILPMLGQNTSLALALSLAALALLPASEAALAVVNFAVTRLLDASIIPGLALRDGVPEESRTLVVVPALLTSRDDIEELIDRLEVHYLSNSAGEVYFALLSDWTDADAENAAPDAILLEAALEGIFRLNQRHGVDRFLLLHRARQWNPQQGKWMGWERKRGKLHELNRLLRGAPDTSYMVIGGKLPGTVRFVLTLDADTKLPRDAVRRLVGKIAHPLNTPIFDPQARRVVRGYGVLQPRVTPSLPTGHYGSVFQRVFSSPRGTDPYVFAVSDVYQDLFDEGSFAGKGIYDIDAFEAALVGRVPENAMLSHDLFEGVFARAGLITDIEVVEEYPERYAAAAARQHRWTRGDWQLLPWMLGRRGAVPALGLWKMADNIRRSLTPVAMLVSFFAGWALLPTGLATGWTVFLVLTTAIAPLLPALSGAVPRRRPLTVASRVKSSMGDFAHSLALTASNLMFLGHQAWLTVDAVTRTLYRLVRSGKNLLEWTTAAQAESNAASTIAANYRFMAVSVATGLGAVTVAVLRGGTLWIAIIPFAIAWLAAPAAAFWMSRSPKLEDELESSPAGRKALRLVARRTWRFFETFVTAADNMLPPDNFQEEPKPIVAHRTSPTNIGLYLISVASARQFGWLGLADATGRLEATLATVAGMETYNGHLYNWYDTETLRPLEPQYVSMVDSGNLAGHLIALANCCDAWRVEVDGANLGFDGIEDVIDLLAEDHAATPDDRRGLRPLRKKLDAQIDALRRAVGKAREAPEYFSVRLIDFAVQSSAIHATAVSLAAELDAVAGGRVLHWAGALRETVESHFKDASADQGIQAALAAKLEALASTARSLAYGMEFGFLLEPQRNLLSIGYRVHESMRDESCYDMLASEARLGSFFAIAKGDLRTRHWFRLGRAVTAINGGAALVSWSGSMFEYLMPSLVMRAPSGGLLDQTTRLIVARQVAYAEALGIPWGISESAFSARDIAFTYQYSNFGVPGLGLKRGLSENTVIAPYATGLAAMVAPRLAARNYERLARAGGRGDYGYYEALDYTPSRLRKGESVAIVRAFFAHHQGMTVVAIHNAVKNGEMRAHFHAEPAVRATELLLQERAPRDVQITYARTEESANSAAVRDYVPVPARTYDARRLASPATHLFANGQLSVMMTAAGSGYSSWNGLALTRWREDSVCDDWGAFFYLRELRSGKVWSAGHMPVATAADSYLASFSEDRAEIIRTDGIYTTTLECIVSPEDNAEARRVTVLNSALSARDVEITSYAELVLAPAAADAAHQAFSKLFVQTEYLPGLETLLATRRRRSPGDPEVWLAQFMLVEGAAIGALEYETDRARFIGIGRSTRNPVAVAGGGVLSNTVGAVLDPVIVLRRRVRIAAGRQARFTYWTVAAGTRDEVLDLVDRHRQEPAYNRALMLAWTQAQIQLRHLSIEPEEAQLYQTLASHLIYANMALRASAKTLAQDIGPQSALWPQGISGDRPILLARIDDVDDMQLIRQLLRAFEYWKSKRLEVDLVILNDRMSSYVQDLQGSIETLVRKGGGSGEGGRVFTLRADLLSPVTLSVLPAIARVVLFGRRGSLSSQLARIREAPTLAAAPIDTSRPAPQAIPRVIDTKHLEFFNGFGGFDKDGREYVTVLDAARPLPAPWINVIANPVFGFHSAADGGGYTWCGNSRENQITGWSNDPISNRPSEVFYVRSDDENFLVSPTLAPLHASEGTHLARHGFGYTIFDREVRNLRMELLQTLTLDDSVKICRLKISNQSTTRRRLDVTFYAEWVLGASRAATAPFVTTTIDEATGAMFARNRWSTQASEQVAFADMRGQQTSWSGDRREFLGPFGNLAEPRVMARGVGLSNRTGGGLNPCCALRTSVTLEPGGSAEVTILLGAAPNTHEAQALVARYREVDIDSVLTGTQAYWAATLDSIQVKTPDRSFDVAMNGWLLYQTLACRMWARSGFYQVSGAYGFRDQLQDSMAFLTAQPAIAREHILRAAARQFTEGDFQHWWLPATGMGVRTRISDDTAWLAYCVNLYVKTTGDIAILDESASFIEGQSLQEGEHDAFFLPAVSDEAATLYEHCARALDSSLAVGDHGLPLIGTGDWNDGMNRVGEKGKGESVWLGWFLLSVLKDFAEIARLRGDGARAEQWRARAGQLELALEKHGWDGRWYRRGFYDDGEPLGSAQSEECRIDAIAQSWAVISGGTAPKRAAAAMEESYRQLVKPDDSLAILFAPPFDKTPRDPGYIKAYPPGIRENGGQYTHGAIWSVFAHSELNQPDRAAELFTMLNPINHALTKADALKYRVEPYVIAADVYSVPPHTGRGGWTWYTGSAGWMYRAGLEAILGITREGLKLRIRPRMPSDWDKYEVVVRFGDTLYEIEVSRLAARDRLPSDVETVSSREFLIDLVDSGGVRRIVLPLELVPALLTAAK
ncbi:MAG: GH36-type glycosyl hydrolase domain-containing protein [Aestuariivirga sp.]